METETRSFITKRDKRKDRGKIKGKKRKFTDVELARFEEEASQTSVKKEDIDESFEHEVEKVPMEDEDEDVKKGDGDGSEDDENGSDKKKDFASVIASILNTETHKVRTKGMRH